jgi:UDP-N-acetylmuramate dehydrogenase
MINELIALGLRPKQNEILAPYTTWGIGGPADIFVDVYNTNDLVQVKLLAEKRGTPITILGSGSNVLISDEGIRGLVVRNRTSNLVVDSREIELKELEPIAKQLAPRLTQIDTDKYYSFAELDYDESLSPKVSIIVDSGHNLTSLINKLINIGITGLQWFAGIPGTIGGAVYNNIHGGSHYISEYVDNIDILDQSNERRTLLKSDLEMEYDSSRFHRTQELILTIRLTLYRGDTKRAMQTAISWAQKKKIQPYKSAGCCFKNLGDVDVKKLGLATGSWGYLIDQILNLKGTRIGDAMISPKHAAFIENMGYAKATDVLALFDIIYRDAQSKVGITPKLEIFLLGFPESLRQKYS